MVFDYSIKSYQRIYYYVLKKINNREDTEDILQEIYLSMCKRSENHISLQQAYVRANNLIINMRKKKENKNDQLTKFVEDENIKNICENAVISDSLDEKERSTILNDWMNQLPKNYRMALKLHFLDGYSYQQTAEICEKPIGTVKSDINRGLKKLREIYKYNEEN